MAAVLQVSVYRWAGPEAAALVRLDFGGEVSEVHINDSWLAVLCEGAAIALIHIAHVAPLLCGARAFCLDDMQRPLLGGPPMRNSPCVCAGVVDPVPNLCRGH